MRPQARILLALGAIILAGLVAYALMPGKKVPAPEPAPELLPLPGETTLPTSVPTTAPETPADPFGDPVPMTMPSDSASTRPLTPPLDPFRLSRTPTPPEPETPARSARTYTVQSGDSLYVISQKVYGDARHVDAIRQANPGINPSRLRIGQVLKMPDANALPGVRPDADRTAERPAGGERTPERPSLGAARTYKVQPGDNLRRISQRFYGNTGMWQKIYDLNRSTIGANPDSLRVGMTLRLPEGASEQR
jgi:nucleoid-associated protein YgaU